MHKLTRTNQKRATDLDEQVLPLINIVFLLLIFFMITGRLTGADPFDLKPVYSTSTDHHKDQRWVIHLAPNGQLALNGQNIERNILIAKVQSSQSSGKQLVWHLKADAEHKAGPVLDLMMTLKRAGMDQIHLITREQEL